MGRVSGGREGRALVRRLAPLAGRARGGRGFCRPYLLLCYLLLCYLLLCYLLLCSLNPDLSQIKFLSSRSRSRPNRKACSTFSASDPVTNRRGRGSRWLRLPKPHPPSLPRAGSSGMPWRVMASSARCEPYPSSSAAPYSPPHRRDSGNAAIMPKTARPGREWSGPRCPQAA